ncbi:hypothetical protein, partial [Proteus columbae]|uniref:hypothetical protein n=1 Tax=Proteus columbae TaxID=1987580 RepID=UPI00288C1DC4
RSSALLRGGAFYIFLIQCQAFIFKAFHFFSSFSRLTHLAWFAVTTRAHYREFCEAGNTFFEFFY